MLLHLRSSYISRNYFQQRRETAALCDVLLESVTVTFFHLRKSERAERMMLQFAMPSCSQMAKQAGKQK